MLLCSSAHHREMQTGHHVWLRNPDGGYRNNPEFPHFKQPCAQVYQDLCRACLSQQPATRPSFPEIEQRLKRMLDAWKWGHDTLVMPPKAKQGAAGGKSAGVNGVSKVEEEMEVTGSGTNTAANKQAAQSMAVADQQVDS